MHDYQRDPVAIAVMVIIFIGAAAYAVLYYAWALIRWLAG